MKSLNESAISVFKKYNILTEDVFDDEDDEEKLELTAYYYTDDNQRVDLASMKYVNSMWKFIKKLMTDTSKLDALNATALFVDDNKDRDVFSAIKEDDGTWSVDYDNFEEFSNSIFLPDEYRDCTLNRVLYSLFEEHPINFKFKSPSLSNNLYRVPTRYKLGDDSWRLDWKDEKDAIINVRISKEQLPPSDDPKRPIKNQQIIDKKKDVLKEVCDHFGVELKKISDLFYQIIIPDQAKYFDEI